MQYQILGLYVSADGTCYANTYALDATKNWGVYKNGRNVGFVGGDFGYGGVSVVGDGAYLYYAHYERGALSAPSQVANGSLPPKGETWYGIRRVSAANLKDVPFAGGQGRRSAELYLNKKLDGQNGEVTSEAINPRAGVLYAGDNVGNVIHVIDTRTMTSVAVWQLGDEAQPIALTWDDVDQVVWVIVQDGTVRRIVAINPSGVRLPKLAFRLSAGAEPSSILYSQGNLYVADDGPDQNIKVYTALSSKPRLITALGVLHGVYGGPPANEGKVGPWRFNHITGLGFDQKGQLYVSCWSLAGSSLECYDLHTNLRKWSLEDRVYVDLVGVDPRAVQKAYSADVEYKLNWNNAQSGTEYSTSAVTVNPLEFPQDLRIKSNTNVFDQLFYVDGHKFLALAGDFYVIGIYRFDPSHRGHIAIPCSIVTGNVTKVGLNRIAPGIWTDSTGNGTPQLQDWDFGKIGVGYIVSSYFDDRGSLWVTNANEIVELPCTLNAIGAPHYSWQSAITTPFVAIDGADKIATVSRLVYDAADDTMYIDCSTSQHPIREPRTGSGDVLLCIASFKHAPKIKWEEVLPSEASTSLSVEAMSAAGQYLFVQYCGKYVCAVIREDDGTFVGSITPDGSVVGDMTNIWVDQAHGISAVEQPSGEYDITDEDDIYTKSILYRWSPSN